MICLFTSVSMTGTAPCSWPCRFLIATRDGCRDVADCGAHARTQCNVSCAMLLGLASSFLGGLGIGHENSVRWNAAPVSLGGGSLLIDARGACQ